MRTLATIYGISCVTIIVPMIAHTIPAAARVEPPHVDGAIVSGTVRVWKLIEGRDGLSRRQLVPAAGAAVHVKALPKGCVVKAATEPLELKLRDGRIVPEFACIEVNRRLLIKFPEGEAHNFIAVSPARGEFGRTQSPDRTEFTDRFPKPDDFVSIVCDVHPTEQARIQVVPTPIHALCAAGGRFELPVRLPEGDYQLEAFYPGLGWAEQSVSVRRGDARASVDLLLVPKRKGMGEGK